VNTRPGHCGDIGEEARARAKARHSTASEQAVARRTSIGAPGVAADNTTVTTYTAIGIPNGLYSFDSPDSCGGRNVLWDRVRLFGDA
jgi:hypothetical protein